MDGSTQVNFMSQQGYKVYKNKKIILIFLVIEFFHYFIRAYLDGKTWLYIKKVDLCK